MICAACSASNAAEAAICGACGATLTTAAAVQAQIAPAHAFRDPQSLKTLVLVALACLSLALLIGIYLDMVQLAILSDMQSGAFASTEEMLAAAEAHDSNQQIMARIYIAVFALTAFVFSLWIYRVAVNARALGATGFKITPGWAIGWYFLPIANLWMPYKAMSEIWRASRNPMGWQANRSGEFLGWWWAVWVISNIVANASFQLMSDAAELDEISRATQLAVASQILNLISVAIGARLVTLLSRYQTQAARNPSAIFA